MKQGVSLARVLALCSSAVLVGLRRGHVYRHTPHGERQDGAPRQEM